MATNHIDSILVALLACAVYTTIVFMPTQSAEFAASVLSYVKLLKGLFVCFRRYDVPVD